MNKNNLTFEIGLFKITIENTSNIPTHYLDKIDPIFKINISNNSNTDKDNNIYRTANELLELLKTTQEFVKTFIEKNLDINIICDKCGQRLKININYDPNISSPNPYIECTCGKLLKTIPNSKIISGEIINES